MIMSEEIIKVLDYITEKLGIAIDWTTENALPYVEEVIGKFVTYNIVYNAVGVIISIILLSICFIAIKSLINNYNKCKVSQKDNVLWEFYLSSPDITFSGGCAIIGVFVCGLVGIISLLINGSDLMQWSIIPEMALLEEIKYLVG